MRPIVRSVPPPRDAAVRATEAAWNAPMAVPVGCPVPEQVQAAFAVEPAVAPVWPCPAVRR